MSPNQCQSCSEASLSGQFATRLSLSGLCRFRGFFPIETRFRVRFLAFLLLTISFLAPAQPLREVHAGFIFDRHATAFENGFGTEAAGPFFYERKSELAHTWAVPPFFSYTDWLDGEGTEYDFAYPLLTYDRYGGEYRWQLGQLLSFAGGRNQAEEQRRRFTLFPIYFQQRSPVTNENYTAVFPIYGQLKNRLFRSEIDFALWPLYVKTVKRPSAGPAGDELFTGMMHRWLSARRGDMTTHNFVYPFFHLRYGDELFGWQAWPLLGREHKAASTVTNSWGDAELIPGHDKRFYLWPFYLRQQRGLGSDNLERELLVFPFYHQLRSPLRDSTSYLTPFGLTLTDDRERKYREVDAPWPFIVFAWGEGKTTRRVWPLFSHAHTDALESDFILWPVYTHRRLRGETLDRHRTRILYFLYSHTTEANTETAAVKTRTDCWPLFTYRHELDGRTRLQILAPLEPILPASKSIERNYSPLWSLWRAEANPTTGASSQSLLWNLYRRDVTPTTRKGSLLFGLFQYESTGAKRRWRLFYLPLNQPQKESEHVSEHR